MKQNLIVVVVKNREQLVITCKVLRKYASVFSKVKPAHSFCWNNEFKSSDLNIITIYYTYTYNAKDTSFYIENT